MDLLFTAIRTKHTMMFARQGETYARQGITFRKKT